MINSPRVEIYQHPNPEIRSFLTSLEISRPRSEHFKRPLGSGSDAVLQALGPLGAGIVRETMAIPGVLEMEINPREIRVRKKSASTWEAIEPQVMEILKRAFRKREIRLVKG